MKCIKLTKGEYTIVDDADYELLKHYKWCCASGYAMRGSKLSDGGYGKLIQMHREIMETPKGLFTDHIDGDKLNNRKENLRIVNSSQNAMNSIKKGSSSKYKGVSFFKRTKRWTAQICPNGQKIHLGYFNTELEASKAYKVKAEELFGSYSKCS